jgi:hypothetical protein
VTLPCDALGVTLSDARASHPLPRYRLTVGHDRPRPGAQVGPTSHPHLPLSARTWSRGLAAGQPVDELALFVGVWHGKAARG